MQLKDGLKIKYPFGYHFTGSLMFYVNFGYSANNLQTIFGKNAFNGKACQCNFMF